MSLPGRRWDPRSELPNKQNPKSGPKIWIKPRSAVIIGSADPLKFRSESTIRAKIFTKSTDPYTYSPPSLNCKYVQLNQKLAAVSWIFALMTSSWVNEYTLFWTVSTKRGFVYLFFNSTLPGLAKKHHVKFFTRYTRVSCHFTHSRIPIARSLPKNILLGSQSSFDNPMVIIHSFVWENRTRICR